MRIAVKKNGLALQYASERLRSDFETVMIAVKKSGTSLQFASNVLQSNEEIINAAVRSDGNALEFVPEPLRHNRQLILEASRNCNVKPIPEEFLSDKEIALNLVAHAYEAFAYLADVLRADIDIIMTTLENHPFSCADVMMYVPDEVVSNKEGCNTLNAKLSAVLHLISHCSTSRFNEDEWIKDYLILARDKAESPNLNTGEKYEVKIIKPKNNN